MKRPLLFTACGMPLGILLVLFQLSFIGILAILIGFLFLLFLFKCRLRLLLYLSFGFFLGCFSSICYRMSIKPIRLQSEDRIALKGVIKETSEYGFILRVQYYDTGTGARLANPFYPCYILISGKCDGGQGCTVIITGIASDFRGPENPGQFDEKSYYPSVGCIKRVQAESIQTVKQAGIFTRTVLKLREIIYDRVSALYPDGSEELPAALLLGNRKLMGESRRELYEKYGLAHLLSVSGLHIGILAEAFLWFFQLFFNRKSAGRITVLVLLLYGALCGFRISCIRAVFSFSLSTVSCERKRTFDRLSANSFLVLTILFLRPYALSDMSFQMSFLAGYLLCFSKMAGKINKGFPAKLSAILHTSAVIQTGLLPIQVQNFYTFAPVGILLNPVVLFGIEAWFILLLLSVAFSFVFFPLGVFFAGPVYYPVILLERVLCILHSQAYLNVALGHQVSLRIVLYFVLFTVILFLEHRFGHGIWLLLASLFVVFLPNHKGTFTVATLGVGQGDCSVILSGNTVSVIDCGSLSKSDVGNRILKPFLLYCGYDRIDYLFVSHTDEDHVNGIRDCDLFDTVRTMYYDRSFEDAPELVKGPSVATVPGDLVQIGNMTIRFLDGAPGPDADGNDRSQILYCEAEGFGFLFLGDVSSEILGNLLREFSEKPCYVKVPHHGSRYSLNEDFYQTIRADTAVVSVGANSYGHPAEEVLESLQRTAKRVYVTKEDGAVIACIRKRRLHIGCTDDENLP